MIPTTESAKRISTLFGRRFTTHWTDKEVRRYKELVKSGYFTPEDLNMIERYYFVQRKKGDRGIHRRDLYTFLNNFSGELDRARAWETDRRRTMRTTSNGQRPQREATDAEFEVAGQIAKREVEALRKKLIPT